MATQDDELMFSIGVMDKPDIKTRLAAVGKLFEDTQANISKGFVSVGQSVDSLKTSMGGVLSSVRSFRDDSVAAASDIRSAMSLMTASTSGGSAKADLGEMTTAATEAARAMVELERAKTAAAGVSLAGGGSGSGPITLPPIIVPPIEMPEVIVPPIKMPDFELPANMRNVFKELEGAADGAAESIEAALNEAVVGMPDNVKAQTTLLSREWEKRAIDQSEAYASMAADLDGYLAKEGTATEKIQANMRKAQTAVDGYAEKQREAQEKIQQASVKSIRALVKGAKGFAEIGLMSEENSQKFLQSMAMIQGAFDIFESGADLLEAFSAGWKGVRQATDAASKAASVQKALAGTQFVQLKAYQAQLLQEEIAANRATAANMRLAASRGGKGIGGAVGAAGSLVDGAKQVGSLASTATKAGGVAAAAGTAAKAGGFLAPTVAGIGVGVLGTIAAAGAALAALSLVAVELSETFSGTAGKVGSVTDTIASGEVSFIAGAMRMTGMFEKADSIGTTFVQSMSKNVDATLGQIPVVGRLVKALNVFGDTAALAASNAAVERMQKKTARNKIDREAKDEIENVTRDAGRERFDNEYKTSSEVLRNNAGKVGGFDIKYSTESRIQNQTQSKLAQEQKKIEDYSSGVTTDKTAFDTAVKNATELKKQLQESLDIQMQLSTGKGNQRGQAEWENQQLLMDQLIIQQDKLNAMKENGTATEKEMSDAVSHHQKLVENLNGSYEKQRGIIKETAAEQVQTEMRKQDMLRGQLDLQTAQIQKIEDQYRSAGIGFAKLGDIEKQMAADALQQAKTKGAASLEDYQKDLLRQVGSSEATRFANEGDMEEAKKFGFDASFGDSINQERTSMEATRTSIEAQLSTSYDVSVKLQSNAEDVANMVIDKANKLLEDQLGYIDTLIGERMNAQVKTINEKATFEKSQKKANSH